MAIPFFWNMCRIRLHPETADQCLQQIGNAVHPVESFGGVLGALGRLSGHRPYIDNTAVNFFRDRTLFLCSGGDLRVHVGDGGNGVDDDIQGIRGACRHRRAGLGLLLA